MNFLKTNKVLQRLVRLSIIPLLLIALGAVMTEPSGVGAQTSGTITFAAIGDYGSDDQHELDVANLVKSWNPEFIITLGDNNYPSGEASTIDANIGKYYHEYIYPYRGTYGPGATTNRFWPSVGNHDWDNQIGIKLQPYLDYFTLPGNERYYDIVRGPVHFFMLDSDGEEPDGYKSTSVQANWLRTKLAASTSPWKIVVLHHPPFSSRTSYPNLQWPFQQWGASAVLAGHAHLYERVMKNGIPFITNGLGGESTGDFYTPIEGSMVRFGDDYGAMRITASSSLITFEFITHRGVVIDNYSMGQQPSLPAAPGGLSATASSSSQINLAWSDNSSNENGFYVESCAGAGCTNFGQIAQTGINVTSYSNSGLTAGTTYRYRVRSFNANGNSSYSNVAESVTSAPPTVPAAPTNLTAVAATSSQINLTWSDNSTSETGFYIERCTNLNCTSFTQIAQATSNAATYSNSSLSAGVTYRYRIRAFNATGTSAYSNIAQAATSIADPFGPPSNLIATAVSSGQIDLRWTDNSTAEDGFKLYRSIDGIEFSRTAILAPNVTTYSNTGRPAATTYYYRVLAFNATGNTAFSNTVTVTTFPEATVKPNAPSNLSAVALSSSQIRLNWSDNSNNEYAFKLYRSLDGITFVEFVKPGPNVTTYTDTTLTSGTTYYYRVRSYNEAGSSSYSNIASARTQ
ncbi:MAG TPA: fibronectin type III domain-containing protein [Pyrinomonadaceae bacterium]|nr:fibronectin type III domain-containing protein [Pyrinomonadaceae bacterium]